ncbi:MAG: diguanylate cyclase, partial [Lachnospiraceae bacterium]|nr:diguanylate cyclase [Lachnospiraceae bacterium]
GAKDVSEQRMTVRQHVEIGNRIARMFEDSIIASGIILQTHETWDGMGYPNHLKGEEISIEARIIYLVNTYVTFTGERPAGYGRTKETTLDYIREKKGQLYDPELADKFIEFMETYD